MASQNQLTGQTLNAYVNQLTTDLATEPATAAALLVLMDVYDQGTSGRNLRFKQVIDAYLKTVMGVGGKILGLTITVPGTGYVDGQQIPIAGDGTGANCVVATTGGLGELLTVNMINVGGNYTTATPDFTAGPGSGATGSATPTYEPEAIVKGALAIL